MITLDKNYYLTKDAANWMLHYEEVTCEINKKTGKPITLRDVWYYPKLSQALNRYMDQSLKPAESVEGLVERLIWAETNVLAALNKGVI